MFLYNVCGVLIAIFSEVGCQIVHQVNSGSTLQYVHVIFRHGQRTTDESTIYPNDPYKDEAYFPYGKGELTNEGKETEYVIGQALRERYINFLGEVYNPNDVYALSSPVRRAKYSMQLVLAALFQPSASELWNYFLNWQPTDFEYFPIDKDLIFLFYVNCEAYLNAREKALLEAARNGKFHSYKELSKFLSINSGWNITSPYDIFLLYAGLKSESEWGLTLPAWTAKVYPQPLTSVTELIWKHSVDNDYLKRLSGGFLLRQIAEDTIKKINGTEGFKNRKISLYSGHDFSIVSFLGTLGLFEPHHPPYGSYILIELHKFNRYYVVKVFYQDYSGSKPKLLELPGCGYICPLDKFLHIYSKYFATADMCRVNDFNRKEYDKE